MMIHHQVGLDLLHGSFKLPVDSRLAAFTPTLTSSAFIPTLTSSVFCLPFTRGSRAIYASLPPAFAVPVLDKASSLGLASLAVRAAGRDHPSIHLMTSCLVAISTSLFISINLGSLATRITTHVLLATTFMMDALEVGQLFLAHRAGNVQKSIEVFTQLMLAQTMALVLPLFYLACFLAAFFGPNAQVLGNIGNGYWHYVAVEDIWRATFNIVELLVVDVVAIIISATIGYKMAGFNVFKTLGYLQKEYGMMIAVSQGYLTIHNFCVIIVACALDLTFKFNWVLKEGSGQI